MPMLLRVPFSRFAVSRARVPVLIALATAFFDCASLEPIAQGTCGNGVVDSVTEDCDSFPSTCGKATDGLKACRLTCDRKQASSCPVGWGCSVDGFCREATGTIQNAGAPLSAGAAALITGDFDGDGRVDIIGAPPYSSGGGSRVHYFDNDANLATSSALSVPIRIPVIKDFTRDGIDDVGFSANIVNVGGFAAMAGRGDRTFSPILFPAITLEKVAAVPTTLSAITDRTFLPGFNRSCVVAVIQTEKGSRLHSYCGDELTGTEDLDLASSANPATIVGTPKTAIVFDQFPINVATSVCGEIITAHNEGNQGKLTIVSPCEVVNESGSLTVRWIKDIGSAKKTVEVSTPGKLVEAPFAGDLTDDGYADIVIHTESGYYLAKSTHTGLTSWETFTYYKVPFQEVPLAAADLNKDGAADIVFPSGVLFTKLSISTDGGPVTVDGVDTSLSLPSRDGQRWADARIGNFNGDDIPDVLVFYEGSLDAELLTSSGRGLFTTFVVRSDQAVRAIVDGDFDGDLIQDIAFLQSPRALDDPNGAGEIELALAYGRTSGGPETPKVVGRFTNARAVTALHDPQSSVDSIAVMETIKSAQATTLPTTAITVLFGSGGRQVIAPLFMRDDDAKPPYDQKGVNRRGKTRVWAPAVLAAGAIQAPNTIDLMSIATGITIDYSTQPVKLLPPFPTGVWVAPHNDTAAGGIGSFSEVQRITDLFGAVGARDNQPDTLESVIVATIGDIDVPKNGLDEVVTIARLPADATSSGVYIVRPGAGGEQAAKLNATLTGVRIKGGDPINLVDVNGDGAPDLVLLTTVANKRSVIVLLNDGKGSFSASPATVELPPSASSSPTSSDDPLGVAHIITGATPGSGFPQRQLVIVTDKRLFVAQIKPDGASFDVREETARLVTDAKVVGTQPSTTGTIRLTAVAGGDFDGDGVEDIAVADSGSIRILRQAPRLK